MKPSLTSCALFGALSLAAACSNETAKAAGVKSKIDISSHAKVSEATQDDDASANAICATFSLTPYSFDSDGNPIQAGQPVTFTTSDDSGATVQILGCVTAAEDTYDYVAPPGSPYTSGSYNWAYLVSASNFQYCDPTVMPPLDLTTMTAASAYFAPVECVAGIDTPLNIEYPVSIAVPGSGGYIDVSVGVDSSTQYIGCKMADTVPNTDGTNQLHFGQALTADDNSNVPWGLVGYTISNTGADATVAQYGGQVSATDPDDSSSTLYNSYYTGQFSNDTLGLPSALFQTFLTNGVSVPGQETYDYGACINSGGECDAWVDTRHPMCLTTQVPDSNTFTTTGLLADAFIYIPSMGFAAASVTSAGAQITLYSQVLASSADDYSDSADGAATLNGAPGFSSTSSNDSSQAGFNDGLVTTTLNASDYPGIVSFNGIYIDPINIGQFIVGGATATSIVWAPLSDTGSGWTVGAFADITTAPDGYAEEQTGCLTLCDG